MEMSNVDDDDWVLLPGDGLRRRMHVRPMPEGYAGFVLVTASGPGCANESLALTFEQADALQKELVRRVTDERVRRAEAARSKQP